MLSLMLSRKKSLASVFGAVLVCLVQPKLDAGAASGSIVLAVDYTSEGRPNEDGGNAIETYFEFVLSRIPYGKTQRMVDYNRDCKSGNRVDKSGPPCPLPDFLIQVQIAERQGEFQISGAATQNVEPRHTRALDVTRGQVRDLSEGLWRVTRNISEIVASAASPTERPHVVIACVGSGSKQTKSQGARPRPDLQSPASVMPEASEYAERLPNLLKSQMARDATRIRVSISNDVGAACSSPDGLQRIADIVGAAAVLSGTVYSDDQGGLFLVPYLLISGASKGIELPQMSIPARGDVTYDVTVGKRLATLATALIDLSSYAELVKAIREGAELSYYLDQARKYLSSSPPNYDAADALLELATVKSPAEEQSYLLLASSLSERGRFTAAATTLRSGIRQIPDSKTLFVKLEDIAAREGNLHEALRVHQEALKAGMPEEGALLAIARTYMSAQPPDRSLKMALDYALKAASKNSSFADAYLLAGQISETNENFESAETYYQKARSVAPDSPEILSRLSSLFGRWANEDSRTARFDLAIEHLSKSIELGPPSIRKYYDRAYAYLEYYSLSADRTERAKGYELASTDYSTAYQIARRENAILAQFPWLVPNLMEALIFEGKFNEAKDAGRALFVALASDPNIRSSTDPNDIRVVATLLNATAEMLNAGSAEKELYLFENSLGDQSNHLPWPFSKMLSYLKDDYPAIKVNLEPSDRQRRIDAVQQWIAQLRVRAQ
jgi:tetratricopeptide (TPR) repeat protein